MKRNILYIATICLAVLSLAGCKTDEEPEWENVVVPPVGNTVNGDNNNGQQPEETIDFRAIRLNELDGNKPKFIELYNTASQTVDISGMKLRKNGEEIVYEAPAGTTIAAGGFLMLLSRRYYCRCVCQSKPGYGKCVGRDRPRIQRRCNKRGLWKKT